MSGQKMGASLMTLPDMMALAISGGIPVSPELLIRRMDEILDSGFDTLELSLDILNWYPDAVNAKVLDRMRDLHERNNVTLTAHLPFVSLCTLSHVEDLRRASAQNVVNAIRRVDSLPIEHFILHLDGAFLQTVLDGYELPENLQSELNDDISSQGQKTMEEILSQVDAKRLLLENLPGVPTRLTKAWAKTWDLAICVDVGHLFYSQLLRNKDLFSFFEEVDDLGLNIKELHVHDVVQITQNASSRLADHRQLGTGMIDLEKLAGRVYRGGDAPVVILEMRFDWAKASLPVWQKASQAFRE